MRIPQISIQTTDAKLELKNVIPKGQLDIHQEQPAVIVETTRPQVQIDSTESRDTLGLKDPSRILEEAVQYAEQAVLEFIHRKNAEGEQLGQIENGQSLRRVLSGLAKQSMKDSPVELTIASIPKPQVTYQKGDISISPKTPIEDVVKIHYTPSKLETNYIPYSIKIDVKL